MEKRLKLLIFSVLILLIVSVWALFLNKKEYYGDMNKWDEQDKLTTETEAREVVYLIFPASQNTTQLEITEVTKTPDSDNLLAAGIEEDILSSDTNAGTDSDNQNTDNQNNQNTDNQNNQNTDDQNNQNADDQNNQNADDQNNQNADDQNNQNTDDQNNQNADDQNNQNADDQNNQNADDQNNQNADDQNNQNADDQNNQNADDQNNQNADDQNNQNTDDQNNQNTDDQNNQNTDDQNNQNTELAQTQTTGSPIAAMYLKYAASSSGNLDYILYVPANANPDTPIFIFLHGNGEVGKDMEKAMTRYAFLQDLKNGSWQPGCIIVCPIAKKKSHWKAELNNLNIIIDEVTTNYGGSRNGLYLSGASAGADAMTYIASKISFRGAIYMAGHMNGNGAYSVDSFLNLWAGKEVYYYRDNLAGGGYGYSKAFVDGCKAKAAAYGVNFTAEDLNWNHSVGLVDATFLPTAFIDKNGRNCHDGLARLIY